VPTISLSGTQTSSTLPGHIVKLTAGGLLPSVLPSVDSNQTANPVITVTQDLFSIFSVVLCEVNTFTIIV